MWPRACLLKFAPLLVETDDLPCRPHMARKSAPFGLGGPPQFIRGSGGRGSLGGPRPGSPTLMDETRLDEGRGLPAWRQKVVAKVGYGRFVLDQALGWLAGEAKNPERDGHYSQ